jgi:hypothetical protein
MMLQATYSTMLNPGGDEVVAEWNAIQRDIVVTNGRYCIQINVQK